VTASTPADRLAAAVDELVSSSVDEWRQRAVRAEAELEWRRVRSRDRTARDATEIDRLREALARIA